MEDGDDGIGGDRRDHFHHNEAISAVVDEGFLGEEDDDYEDLYNDVNVGEGFLQSLQRNEAPQGFKTDEKQEEQRTNDLSGVESMGNSAPAAAVAIPGVGPGDGRMEKDQASAVEEAQKGYPGPEYRGNELVPKGPPTGPGGGMRIEVRQPLVRATGEVGGQLGNRMQSHPVGNENYGRIGVGMAPGGNYNVVSTNGSGPGGGGANSGGGTILFVGELHWWTTDAELESELSKYGQVKEVKFFDEKASGKSKGYCQAEFYDPGAAASCKEGMNGHVFNGRPCVVAFASPYSVRRMGEAQVNKSQAMAQATQQQGRRGQGPGDIGGNGRGNAIATGANYQGGDQGRNFGRGGWGRGGGMGNRGQMGPMRNRMGMGGRGIIGNGGSGFGQGLATATPPLLHPQTMMGQGFDPSYGAAMGRMGGYGGFPGGPAPPFSGILPSFPPVGGVGLPSVAPHVNPAFFGRGMPSNGMGMMPVTGVDGSAMGMWSDPNMAGWGGEEQGGRAGESSYGEDATSEHQYGEGSHERGGWSNPAKEKDRASERELPGAGPERRYRDDREPGWERGEKDAEPGQEWPERRHDDREMGWDRGRDRERDRDRDRDRERDRDRGREREQERGRSRDDRDRYREERDRFTDHHRHRDRELDHDDDWERRRSSRTRSKPRMSQEEEHRHRSREVEHGKRRRLPSE